MSEASVSPELLTSPILYEADLSWLRKLTTADSQIADETEWLSHMNALVPVGSQHIGKYEAAESQSHIMAARKEFYGTMPAIGSAFESIEDTHPLSMPIATTVEVFRLFEESNIDTTAVVAKTPLILTYSGSLLAGRLYHLKELGMHSKAVANMPSLLTVPSELITERTAAMSGLGLDMSKIIKKYPYILLQPIPVLEKKIEALSQLGLNVLRVANDNPSVLAADIETTKAKLNFMNTLGLDSAAVVNASPSSANLKPETIQEKVDTLSSYGLDAGRLITSLPKVLEYANDSLRKKIRSIVSIYRYLGMDASVALDVIQEWPMILCYKPGRLQTIGRIAMRIMPDATQLEKKDMQSLAITDHTALVTAYVKDGAKVESPKQLRNKALSYKKLGKEAMNEIIVSGPHDPVVRGYLKDYGQQSDTPSRLPDARLQ